MIPPIKMSLRVAKFSLFSPQTDLWFIERRGITMSKISRLVRREIEYERELVSTEQSVWISKARRTRGVMGSNVMPNGLVAARPGTPLSRHYPSQGSQIQLSPDLYRPTKLPPLSAPMLIPCGSLIASQGDGSPLIQRSRSNAPYLD
jgi:hypothetical protein